MSHINLSDFSTIAPKNLNKKKIKKENEKMIAEIQAFQHKLFAAGNKSMLIVLQGMDASGKDGVVRYIFSGMNPLGTRATSFRVPTKEEASHDFLWRIHQECPAKGMVQVFNRSHYEDILVPTVEHLFDEETIKNRYDQINNFEKLLEDNGTTILKFYLHVSKDKQKEKLNERLTDPTKYWKHNIGDWETRDNYNEYMEVYENIFKKCDSPERHIIAADQNWYKIYQIAKVILKAFESMNLKRPKLSADQETTLLKAKAELAERKEKKKAEKEELRKKEEELKEEFEDEVKSEVAKKVKKKLEEALKHKKKTAKKLEKDAAKAKTSAKPVVKKTATPVVKKATPAKKVVTTTAPAKVATKPVSKTVTPAKPVVVAAKPAIKKPTPAKKPVASKKK